MKLAYLTAGAAGMYCGSCMHDNTLARALIRNGVDVVLTPTYTPIRTDEQDISVDRVFFGGVNIYLQQKVPLFRHLPGLFDRLFDQPWLIRLATARATEMDSKELGKLTVSMLKGEMGFQRKEVHKLCRWLESNVQPDVINLSNMLIAGCVPTIKQRLKAPIVATLQGDDIFLDDLQEPQRSQAMQEIRRLVDHVDGFVVNSQYYADYMSDYFAISADRFNVVPLGIDTTDFVGDQADGDTTTNRSTPTIGYLARLAPEKGLHQLVDAFLKLREHHQSPAKLLVAGWLGKHNEPYAEAEFKKLRDAGLEQDFEHVGSVDRAGKVDFLKRVDVLSVPTVYHEPKGLFVLEALAAGVPVVQPRHGAFPELLERLEGGLLVTPGDSDELAEALHGLLSNVELRREFAQRGRTRVLEQRNADSMAQATKEVLERVLSRARD